MFGQSGVGLNAFIIICTIIITFYYYIRLTVYNIVRCTRVANNKSGSVSSTVVAAARPPVHHRLTELREPLESFHAWLGCRVHCCCKSPPPTRRGCCKCVPVPSHHSLLTAAIGSHLHHYYDYLAIIISWLPISYSGRYTCCSRGGE